MTNYRKRIVDEKIDDLLHTFGAVLIEGPKSCGKTTTAQKFAKSEVKFQDTDDRQSLVSAVRNNPAFFLRGENPRLIDEWQDAPEIWDAVRSSVDDRNGTGFYILTGSSSRFVKVGHTGTGRIAPITMWPMSLYESEESNGQVSLKELFDDPNSFEGCKSDLTIQDLIYAICRGGWPQGIFNIKGKHQLDYSKSLFEQICKLDISQIDNIRRNPEWLKAVLKSYARNLCQLANEKTILADITTTTGMNRNTATEYIEDLKKLYVVEDIYAWNPAIRSKTTMRSSPKHNIVDPSFAVAALGINQDRLKTDYNTLGFLFECMCLRDLKVYAASIGGEISYYRDRNDLEVDCVMHLEDGRYALIECKLGHTEIEKAAKHLCTVEKLIKKHDEDKENQQCQIGAPNLKIVLTGTEYGYKTEEDVLVIPLGCLKN